MNFRRYFLSALLALAAGLSFQTAALAAEGNVETLNPAQPTDSPGKIEVVEFFSYGCPHCNTFNPALHSWAGKQSGDVVFKRIPVTFNRAAWANLAKIFYALEATGDLAKFDGAVFQALHVDRTNLADEKVLMEWAAKKGIDPKKFAEAYGSFGVMSKVKRAEQLTKSYHIDGVPAMAVDGKYLVTANENLESMLVSVDKLVGKLRLEKAGKK